MPLTSAERWSLALETKVATASTTYHKKTWLSGPQQEVEEVQRGYAAELHRVQVHDHLHPELKASAVPGALPKELSLAKWGSKDPKKPDPADPTTELDKEKVKIWDAHRKIESKQRSADQVMLKAAAEKVTEGKPLKGYIPDKSTVKKTVNGGEWGMIFQVKAEDDPNQAHATTTGMREEGIGDTTTDERRKEIKDRKESFAELTDLQQPENHHCAIGRANEHLEALYTEIAVNNTRLNNKGLILPPDTDDFNTSNDHVVMRPIKYTAEWHLEKLIKDPTDLEEVLIEMPPDGTGVFQNVEDRKMAYQFHFQNPNDMAMATGKAPTKVPTAVGETFPPRARVGNRDYKVSDAGGQMGKTISRARHATVDFPRNLFFHMEDGPSRNDTDGAGELLSRMEHDRVMPLMETKKTDSDVDCVIHRNPLHLAVMENDATMVNKLTQLCNCWRDKVAMDVIHPEEHHTYFNAEDPERHLPAKPTKDITYKTLHVEFATENVVKKGQTWEDFPAFAVEKMLTHVQDHNNRFNNFFPNVIEKKQADLTEEFKAFWMSYGMNGRGDKLHLTKIAGKKRCNFFTVKKGTMDVMHAMDTGTSPAQPKCDCDGMEGYKAVPESPDAEPKTNDYDTLQHYLIWKMAGSPPMLKTRAPDDETEIQRAAKLSAFPFGDLAEWEKEAPLKTRHDERRAAYPYPRPPRPNRLVPKGGKGYPAKHVYDAMRYACEKEAEFIKLCDYSMNKYAVGSKPFCLAIPEQSEGSYVNINANGKGLGFTVVRREPYFKKVAGHQHYRGTDRNNVVVADPTDLEQAPDNQYGLIRKDARPWNHACLAPDRFQWRGDLAPPVPAKGGAVSITEGLEYQSLAGKRDGRGAVGEKMMNYGDPWEWWQNDDDHMQVIGLEGLDKRTGSGGGFHSPSIWKTDILPKDTPDSHSRHDRHPYILPFTPFHLAAVYNSDLAMRELLKHWISWRPYHDMNGDWAHPMGFWSKRLHLKKEVAFFSGIRYVVDGKHPPNHKPPDWDQAEAKNLVDEHFSDQHMDRGVNNNSLFSTEEGYDKIDYKTRKPGEVGPEFTPFLKAPEEMKVMLAEERIPLWRHTHYHDHSSIGDAHWQKKSDVSTDGKRGHEYGVEVPTGARNGEKKWRRLRNAKLFVPLPMAHFKQDRQKRIHIAEQMRNHRWYQLEGALFTGYHTHIRAFGHKINDTHRPPEIKDPKAAKLAVGEVDANKQRTPMVPYQLSPLQLAAKQDNIETARVLIHDFEYMVLDGAAVQVEATYRQLMFPDEPARKFEMVPANKKTPDPRGYGDTDTRETHVKLPAGWDFPSRRDKARAMYNSPFVGDLIGNGDDGGEDHHVPIVDITDKRNGLKLQKRMSYRLIKSWRILMQQEYHEMCMRNVTDEPFNEIKKSKDRKKYTRGIPWDAMYKVPERSPERHEQKTDYTEQWDRLGEFDFMHVFGASANHEARPPQKYKLMHKRLVGDTMRTQYFKKGHDAEPERRVRARTALDIAVYWGHFEMAKMLINAIVDLRSKDNLALLTGKGYHHPEWDLLHVLQNAWEVNNLRRDYAGAKRKKKPKTWFKKKKDKSDEQEDEIASARRELDEYIRAGIDYPYLRPTLASRVLRFKSNKKSTMHKRHFFDATDPFAKGRFAAVVARLLRPAKDFAAYKVQKWQEEDDEDDEDK